MDQYDERHPQFISAPDFPAIEAKARSRGFRNAPPSEIRASGACAQGCGDLYGAFGGLWMKEATANA